MDEATREVSTCLGSAMVEWRGLEEKRLLLWKQKTAMEKQMIDADVFREIKNLGRTLKDMDL